MVEVGVIRGVTGLLWKLSIMFWKLSVVFIMFNMTWQRYIVQLSSTEETLANQDWVIYSINDLKFIRSECQKDPQSKIIPWPALQCIRSLGIQRRRQRGRRGGVTKKAFINSNHNVKNLITLDRSIQNPLHLTPNELNDSGLNLKIGTGNLQSLKGKAITLHDCLIDSKTDVFVATETWLKDIDRDEVWLLGSCINKGDFRCVTSNRSGTKKGGGLAIVYKPGSGIKCVSMENGEKSSFQFAVWKLEIKNKVLTVVRIYRPPTKHLVNDSNAIFITEFLDFIGELQLESKNIVILGNFNLHVNDKLDTDAQQFSDMVEASGMKQWINFPTHKQGNTLDLIITELAAEVQIKNVYCGPYISHHCIITCTYSIPKTKMVTKQIKYRDCKKEDMIKVIKDMNLDSINLGSENLEELLSEFRLCVLESVEKHAPVK